MLESLRQGAGSIHQLNLDGAFPEPALYRPRGLYEALKLTPLYDAQREQWNWYMSEEQEFMGSDRFADAQLLGVLAEAQFNPEGALTLYENLKTTPLYDAEHGQWKSSISKDQERNGTVRLVTAQLAGVLAEARFNPEGARTLYEKLKATPLYDAEHEQWDSSISKEQELQDTHRYATSQLMGVLVEARFNPKGARALYEELKATPLYDAQRGQWNRMMSREQKLLDTDRYTYAQLLGVLVAAQFDPEGARALYEELKACPLYDASRRQWNCWMSKGQEPVNASRVADAQLLGVVVEAKLLATLPRPLWEAIPPLPITEDW